MLQNLEPGQPMWLTWCGGLVRCRVEQTYTNHHGAPRIVIRVLERAPGLRVRSLMVVKPLELRWRDVDHRRERETWLAGFARLLRGSRH